MKQYLFSAFALAATIAPLHAETSRFDRSLQHLDPLTRMEQVCAAETMARVSRDNNPYNPDLAIIYALSAPKRDGDTVMGNGGAFRSKGKWYQYSFVCMTTPDHTRVSSFNYTIRGPIPESSWESYGLAQ